MQRVACGGLNVLVGGLDAGAGQDIVELVEKHPAPGFGKTLKWIRLQLEAEGQRGPFLGGRQGFFTLAIQVFGQRRYRIATARVVLKLLRDTREARFAGP